MPGLASGVRIAHKIMRRVNTITAFCSGLLVFVYMFIVSSNIGGRYLFNKPIDGTMEMGQIVLATVIFFNLAYAQMEGAHIRVTAVLDQLPARWRQRVETAIVAIGFLTMALLAWRSFPFAMESFELQEAHMSVDIPIWPTKFIFFIGWTMFGIQFLLDFLGRIVPGSNPTNAQKPVKG